MKKAILFIDDEPLIRELGKEILKTQGLKVYTAEDGIEGIKVFEENKEKIGLIILDFIMPKMGGYETFNRLKTIDEGIKVIIITGYTPHDDDEEERLVKEGVVAIVKKPFTVKDLLSAVNKAMK